jgi:phage internal scaffolding protein
MKLEPFVRNPYNYDVNEASDETAILCKDPSLTQQQFAEESDINFIADRYGLTGEIPQVLDLPQYGDFSGIFDFQSAQNAVIEAKQQFMTLPAKLRTRFDNDPQKLLQFLGNTDNRAEAEFLGLIDKPKETTDETRTGSVHETTAQKGAPTTGTTQDKNPGPADQKPGPKAT